MMYIIDADSFAFISIRNRQEMNSIRALAAALTLAVIADTAMAQQNDTMPAVPRFERFKQINADSTPLSSTLPTWTYGWSFSVTGDSYSATVIGSDPTTDTTAKIPVYLIPVRIRVGVNGGTTFSPDTLQSNGKSAVANTKDSPLLKHLTFDEAGTDLGNTQYIDAYQRANFWSSASTNTRWHTLLGPPTVLPIQEIKAPLKYGIVGVEFGVTVALADIDFIDTQLQAILVNFPEITPSSLVIFEMYDTYLTSEEPRYGGCCIGGYHSALSSGQVYMAFSNVGTTGVFSQDVDALSHELAESVMDPFVDNNSPCGLLEVAGPLEDTANYGTYPVCARRLHVPPAGLDVHHVFRCAGNHVAGRPHKFPGHGARSLRERRLESK
ncbi:MAG: hypothetical protein ABSH33_21840 [Steroidobacteraceae bacterium]